MIMLLVVLTTRELWSELFMLARSVFYRRAIKRRRERGLLALLARWPVKLRYEFVLCKHMMKILILPRREINDDVSVEG